MTEIDLDAVYLPSEDVVSRVIEGDLIIVPLAAGIGDAEDELYTLNETGREIWQRLDGERTLAEVSSELAGLYDAPAEKITRDVVGLMVELVRRRIVCVRTT
jgi:hypothetical protein